MPERDQALVSPPVHALSSDIVWKANTNARSAGYVPARMSSTGRRGITAA
ncbi:MAG: hypothetical protein HOY71_16670 [Nonomuraea sp.]|nr:hypothetical protein [Nonomuraea sp.]